MHFQHYAYLNQDITDRGFDLEVIGETLIAPLGIYSKKLSSVDVDIKWRKNCNTK